MCRGSHSSVTSSSVGSRWYCSHLVKDSSQVTRLYKVLIFDIWDMGNKLTWWKCCSEKSFENVKRWIIYESENYQWEWRGGSGEQNSCSTTKITTDLSSKYLSFKFNDDLSLKYLSLQISDYEKYGLKTSQELQML